MVPSLSSTFPLFCSLSKVLLLIFVFKVERLGICVVLFLAAGSGGIASSLISGSSTTVGRSTLGDDGAGGGGTDVSTFFFQHLIRAGQG